MTPCGQCLNCRGGYFQICLHPVAAASSTTARRCTCGGVLSGKERYCDACRIERNRETARGRMRKRREILRNIGGALPDRQAAPGNASGATCGLSGRVSKRVRESA